MFGVLAALPAILLQDELFRRVDFIPIRNIVLGFAHRTNEGERHPLIFLSHRIRL